MKDPTDFLGKIIVVTGAAGGIGRQIARLFLAHGATVVGCDTDAAKLETDFVQEDPSRERWLPRQLDVRDTPCIKALVREVFRIFGRIDVLVNCAGVCSGTRIEDMTEEEWDRTFAVNVKGLFFLSQAVSAFMKRQKAGRIVNIGSLAGFTGGILSNAAYSASKAAVTCTTKNLAKSLAPYQVTVNEVAPGTAQTAMSENFLGDRLPGFVEKIPLGRLCQPADVADAVLFLSSDAAAFITGQTLHVDGGMYM